MTARPTLSDADLEAFVEDGFVRIDEAFPTELAEAGRERLWQDTGCDPQDRTTWKHPVLRLGDYGGPPFDAAVNAPRLVSAYDQLVGQGRWLARASLGTFPVRFPSAEMPGDDGWHVDASFPGDDPADYMAYRVNLASKGRALLMLFLFSDVSADDAPTRIRIGSHRQVARILEPHGEAGLGFMEIAARLDETESSAEASATGPAGTVYLCHPFLAHAAQPHRGSSPRFMAQPPLLPAGSMDPFAPAAARSPVEEAIHRALLPQMSVGPRG